MYVHGPSGAGKTALVESFLDGLSIRDDVLVLSGRCYERESVRYKALDSVVDFLSRYLSQLPVRQIRALIPDDGALLAELFPVLASVIDTESTTTGPILDLQERRRRAVVAFRTLLSRLASRVHLVICIDDLQWGDLDSALLISELLHQPGAPACSFLRPIEAKMPTRVRACARCSIRPPTAGSNGVSCRSSPCHTRTPGNSHPSSLTM